MIVQPDVSICTMVREPDEVGVIEQLLQAVSCMGNLVEAEVVIAAPNMENPTLERLEREFPQTKWIETQPGNRAFLRNQTVRVATGRYLVFWEPNWRVSENDLKCLVDFMDDTPETGVTAPALLEHGGRLSYTAYEFPGFLTLFVHCLGIRPFFYGHFPSGDMAVSTKQPLEVDWLKGDVLIVRREAFDEIGEFRESFRCVEEMEWCLRIRRAGWHIHFLGNISVCGITEENGAIRNNGVTKWRGAVTSALFRFMLHKWLFRYRAFGLTHGGG